MTEYLTATEAAARVDLTVSTWGSWRRRRLPRGNPVPPPDRRNPLSGVMEWQATTVDTWQARRPGRGARTDLAAHGTQPTTDTHIQCLECGRWYRHLSTHVWNAHGLRPDAYREKYGLSVHHPLAAPTVRRRLSESARDTRQRRPDIRERTDEAMRKRVQARRSGYATARAGETRDDWLRPEALEAMRRRRADLNRKQGEQTIAHMETHARQLGFADLAAYFADGRPDREMATALGMSRSRVSAIRVQMTGTQRPPGPKESTHLEE